MATRYVDTKTSRLYSGSSGEGQEMVLIFGDEVTTSGGVVSGRRQASYRGRAGWVTDAHLRDTPVLEMYFLGVGQADAAFIVTPGRRKILVDGGRDQQAAGFLIWKYHLHEANAPAVDIDLVVLSHADSDHVDGLVPVVEHPLIRVHAVVHNGIATYASGAHDTRLGDLAGGFLTTRHDQLADLAGAQLSDGFRAWRDALVAENVAYRAASWGGPAVDVGDPSVSIRILGPRLGSNARLPWFGDVAHTINGHSVVFSLACGDVVTLFSGDLNVEGSGHLLGDPALENAMRAHVLKSPHHGSHEFSPAFLAAVRPQVVVVSSGDSPDHGHPRAEFLGAVGLAGRSPAPLLFSTEIAATFVDAGTPAAAPGMPDALGDVDFGAANANVYAYQLFRQRLPGIINVRTDGTRIFAARRVLAGYWWESYGPLSPAPWPTPFSG